MLNKNEKKILLKKRPKNALKNLLVNRFNYLYVLKVNCFVDLVGYMFVDLTSSRLHCFIGLICLHI